MGYVLKRLALGISLIGLAAAVLLVSDRQHRRQVRPGGDAPAARVKIPRVAIFQFASRQILDDSVRGCLDALAGHNLIPDKTVRIRRYNAESDLPTANTIAKAIVGGGFDLAITFSTPALQTLAAANLEGKVVHVFGTVTDPYLSGVGFDRKHPDVRPRHLAGIGTFQPVKEVFRLAKQCYPDLTRVGVVWCTSETCSEACLVLAREVCKELGITLLEAPVQSSVEVLEAAQSLVARAAQAIWIGGDNIVEMAAESVIKPALAARIPVFANAPDHAQAGALLGLGANYYEVGRAAGNLAVEILNGRDPAAVPIENVVPQQLAVNLGTLAHLRDPWKITPETLRSAAIVIDAKGLRTTNSPAAATPALPLPQAGRLGIEIPADLLSDRASAADIPVSVIASGSTTAAVPASEKPDRKWRLVFLHYVQSQFVEETCRGFFERLEHNGLRRDRDYAIKIMNAQSDMAALTAMAGAAADDRPDLILLTSTPTLQAVIRKVRDIPVVFGAVGSPVLAGAGQSDTRHLPNITGISTLSDFDGMVAVVKECLPDARRIGTLFVPAEINSVLYRDALAEAARRGGLELESAAVSTSTEVPDAAMALASKPLDAICQITDNLNDASFPGIVQAARRCRKPLMAFVSGQAIDGGAALAVARDYEQVGRDMADLALRILRGESPAAIPFQPASRSRLVINPANAERCGLILPPALLKRADRITGQP